MFEVLKGGKKKTVEEMSVLEKLQENARLKKEVAAIEKELDKTQKLSCLLELALQAKENRHRNSRGQARNWQACTKFA